VSLFVVVKPFTALRAGALRLSMRDRLYASHLHAACSLTLCLHFTAGCTTGWVNYANEPSQAALVWSSQDAYDIIRLKRSKAAVWTVDVVACLIEI